MERGRRGRTIARAVFAVAIGVAALTVFFWVATPGSMGPEPAWEAAVPVMAMAGLVIGLAWMWRILHADPEPDQRSWRYRDR